MKFFRTLILIGLAGFSLLAQAEDEEIPAKSLVELLELVKEGKVVNSRVNSEREKQFLADRARQASEVRRAERERCGPLLGRPPTLCPRRGAACKLEAQD